MALSIWVNIRYFLLCGHNVVSLNLDANLEEITFVHACLEKNTWRKFSVLFQTRRQQAKFLKISQVKLAPWNNGTWQNWELAKMSTHCNSNKDITEHDLVKEEKYVKRPVIQPRYKAHVLCIGQLLGAVSLYGQFNGNPLNYSKLAFKKRRKNLEKSRKGGIIICDQESTTLSLEKLKKLRVRFIFQRYNVCCCFFYCAALIILLVALLW